MTLVGKQAPNFTATAIMADNTIESNFNLHERIDGKICVLFFYPLDFTFVCPTEILAFNDKIEKFKENNVELFGISVDSHFSHLAYKNTPTDKGGIGHIKYPLISDITKRISRDYGVLCNEAIAYRGTFIVNEQGMVIHECVNELALGRNVDETLRLIEAWKYHKECGEVCPANWNRGAKAMKATQEGVSKYLANRASNG